ncbi:MAG: hypothetical protein K0S04_1787 [Herbinix sp.]|nr:hypothetical protein [Herbinix sp.]
MNQVRYTEYQDTMRKSCDYPTELDYLNGRLHKKIRQRNARRFLTGMGAFVGAIVLFIAAINTSTVIAQTIERIPVIGDLAKYVRFDKGLENAVKNQFAQEVNLEQEVNGLTLKIPYVIADSKQLVLFFQLPESISDHSDGYQVVLSEGALEKLDCRSVSYRELKDETGASLNGLHAMMIRSDEAAIPQDISITVSLVKLYSTTNIAPVDRKNEGEHDSTVLASYDFDLQLKDYQEPVTTVLNQEVKVLDQTVVIHSITEYPTGVEIKATAPNNDAAVICDLQFEGIDENGNTWSIPEGTLPAITYGEAVDIIYYLENDFFNEASLVGLEITGAGMFMKENQMVTIDLLNQTMSPAISDLYIKGIKRNGDTADIIFESDVAGWSMYDIASTFSTRYEDLQGNVNHMTGYQRASQLDGKTQYYITVIWPKDNQVVLERMKAPITVLENSVSVLLNK